MAQMKIKYSVLDLAVISQGKSFAHTFEDSVKLAQLADQNGYTRYWLAEHHNSEAIASSATTVLIGKIAEATQHIRVGSGGIMLPNHSPLIIAEQFGTLAHLYPNRIDLGLGRAPGTDQTTAQAIKTDFYQSAMNFPTEVKTLQTYFSKGNENNSVRAHVAEGTDVPMYILGSSTDSAHLAAKQGLPYAFASHFASTHLLNALAIYRDEFSSSEGETTPYTIAGISVIIADSDEEAQHISTSYYERVLGILTGRRGQMVPPFEMTQQVKEVIAQPAVQQMTKYAFIGSKSTVKKQIEAFLALTKVDEIIAATHVYHGPDRRKSYQYLAEIMKEINA